MARRFMIDLPGSFSNAMNDVFLERRRQVEEEGWSGPHDDGHEGGQLADAAACYALGTERVRSFKLWPWDWKWWKPADRRRDLVRAGALIVAEIERLDRIKTQPSNG